MQTKAEAIALLKDEFQLWETLIARVEASHELTARETVKEALIHLWAWQQHTIAYFDAAIQDREPVSPPWPYLIRGDDEGDVDATNAWIAQTYYGKSWEQAYQDWKTGFLALIALVERLPEQDLQNGSKYPWREGWPLLASCEGTYEHHREHREALQS
jgi:hypothetical protein